MKRRTLLPLEKQSFVIKNLKDVSAGVAVLEKILGSIREDRFRGLVLISKVGGRGIETMAGRVNVGKEEEDALFVESFVHVLKLMGLLDDMWLKKFTKASKRERQEMINKLRHSVPCLASLPPAEDEENIAYG